MALQLITAIHHDVLVIGAMLWRSRGRGLEYALE
jgi:hypothetical protein